jgi:hypothetical protein
MGQASSIEHELAPECDIAVAELNWQAYQSLAIKLWDICKLFQVKTKAIIKIHYFPCDQHKVRTAK